MPKRLLFIPLILVLFFVTVGATLLRAQDQYDSKTEKRLKSMQQYRDNLKKNYTGFKDARLQKAVDASLKILDEGINSGLDCMTKLNTNEKPECILTVRKAYDKSQIGYRLVKYYSILAGKPTTCVKADLGIKPHLKAHGVSKNSGQTDNNRLFICGGNDNKVGAIQIKWRVQDKNSRLVPIIETDKASLGLGTDINNLANKEQVKEAEKTIGL